MNTFRSYIKHAKECFIRFHNTSKLVKQNSAVPHFFDPLLSVWISDETLFLVFDTVLQRCHTLGKFVIKAYFTKKKELYMHCLLNNNWERNKKGF